MCLPKHVCLAIILSCINLSPDLLSLPAFHIPFSTWLAHLNPLVISFFLRLSFTPTSTLNPSILLFPAAVIILTQLFLQTCTSFYCSSARPCKLMIYILQLYVLTARAPRNHQEIDAHSFCIYLSCTLFLTLQVVLILMAFEFRIWWC